MSRFTQADPITSNKVLSQDEERREYEVPVQLEQEKDQYQDSGAVIVGGASLDEPSKSPEGLQSPIMDTTPRCSDGVDRCTCLCHASSNQERTGEFALRCEACVEKCDSASCPPLEAEGYDDECDMDEPSTPRLADSVGGHSTPFTSEALGEFPSYFWWGVEDLLEAEGIIVQEPWAALNEDFSDSE
ncbi:hypothetical protein HJFPF1_13623 [Paramyrothecium foliicola]|nr:hypothetical protein HJFPF1_13623 [Paramyrothecium foliicola]